MSGDRAGAQSGTRTVLVTGAGGAGRTTAAAATAHGAAGPGRRVLLLSAGPREVLERILGVPLGQTGRSGHAGTGTGRPVAVADGLWAVRTDPDREFRAQFAALQEYGRAAFDFTGAGPLGPEELTPLPGAETFALLRALRTAHPEPEGGPDSGSGDAPEDGSRERPDAPWDLVVADLPPTPQALALLALPGQLRRYLRRLLPPEKQAARALRPVLAQLAGVPMPAERLYAAAARWDGELARVQRVIGAPGTSVRLVTEPGTDAPAAVRAARAGCALYGLRLDAVLANRVLPTRSPDEWLAGLSGQQQSVLKELRTADGPPLCELPHLGRDPQGPADLLRLAARADVPAGPGARTPAVPEEPVPGRVEDRLAEEGQLHWRLPLPGASRDALELVRHGAELIVGVGPYRRIVPLPAALRRCRVTGAALEDGELRVRFTPEARLWPENGRTGG